MARLRQALGAPQDWDVGPALALFFFADSFHGVRSWWFPHLPNEVVSLSQCPPLLLAFPHLPATNKLLVKTLGHPTLIYFLLLILGHSILSFHPSPGAVLAESKLSLHSES